MEVSSQQKEMIAVIINKHQAFIEKLIADKHILSVKCEEYLAELRSDKRKNLHFSEELDNLKILSSNEQTQTEYLQVFLKKFLLSNFFKD